MKINFKQPPTAFETNGLAVQYAPSKRQMPSWRWRILVVLVLAPLLVFLARLLYGAVFVSMPGFVTMDHTVVKTPVAGRLVHSMRAGEAVRAGDPIAELRNEAFESQRDGLQTSLAAAQRGAQTASGYAGNAQRAAALRGSAQPLLALRRQQHENMRYLVSKGAATQGELDEAYLQLLQARREVAEAATRDVGLVTGGDAESRALVERLSETSAKIAALRLVAPQDGVVSQVFVKPGEWIAENTEIAAVRGDRPPTVEVFVEPSWAKEARVGQWATIHFLDGYSHRARVAEVKMTAQRLPPDRANPLVVRHHSIIALLEPTPALPERYRINILPVNVEFNLLPFPWSRDRDQAGKAVLAKTK